MPTQVQTRRGTTSQHSSFTGAAGELTVDTDKKTVVVHDGSTAGGAPLLREDQSNLPTSAPTTGIYNASGSLGVATNSTGRLFIDASGNVEIAGTGKRILGDFANATLANRLSFQSSGANLSTVVQAIPNGTATSGQFRAFNNSDPDNAGSARLVVSTTGIGLESVTSGTGSHLPINLSTGGSARLTILTDGKIGIGGTPSTDLHVTNGSGARVRAGGAVGSGFEFNDANVRLDIPAANTIAAYTNNTERARIDSSGRLLVGTSSSIWGGGIESMRTTGLQYVGGRFSADNFSAEITVLKSRGASVGTNTIVQNNDVLGNINFLGADGTTYLTAAQISAQVDGTPGTNDMPGRIVLSTTLDGASSPTERLRITNDGVRAYNQPAPAAVNATATLTVANLKAGIITSTSAAATDMTLPTGTDTQAGFSGTYDNFTFEWSVINTGPSLVRVLAATAHTIVGSGSVATGTSGRFASRRTAANTFVTYRLS